MTDLDYEAARETQRSRNEARHILKKIKDARGAPGDAGIRWPFELLQNAIDGGPRPGADGVRVVLEQDAERFVFAHDGAFFTGQDLAALVSGGSSKEFESPSKTTTGRYGTGFLVTHVLALKTEVSGVYARSAGLSRFALTLERDDRDEEAILRNIAACGHDISTAEGIISADGEASARFVYSAAKESLQLGFGAFRQAIPYLFATCPLLSRVEILVADRPPEIWQANAPTERETLHGRVRERTLAHQNGSEQASYRTEAVSVDSSGATAIAVLRKEDDNWRVLIPPGGFARVFCTYPLRGSDFVPLNIVLNAPFDVDEERRWVLLDKEDVKKQFRSSLDAAVPLVELAFAEQWTDRHWLTRASPCPPLGESPTGKEQSEWLTSELKRLAEAFATMPLVETRGGRRSAVATKDGDRYADFLRPRLGEASVADETTVGRMWPLIDAAEDLYPPTASVEDWSTIALGWKNLGLPVWCRTLTDVARTVRKEARTLDELRLRTDRREWLARFLDVVGDCWERHGVTAPILEGLVPNQRGDLVPLQDLRRDDGISEDLKDIAEAVGVPVRTQLVDPLVVQTARAHGLDHAEAALASAIPQKRTDSDVARLCLETLDKVMPEKRRLSDDDRPKLVASIRLISYLALTDSDISRVPLVSTDGAITRPSTKRPLMAPVAVWDERARSFSALYAADRILRLEYAGSAGPDGWPSVVESLVRADVAVPDPLVHKIPHGPVEGNRLAALVEDGVDSRGVRVTGHEFTQIEALPDELIGRCQQGKAEAAALLGMVLCYLAAADPSWREVSEVTGRRDGVDVAVRMRSALWLGEIRSRAWIPREGDTGKITPVTASAEALASILDPEWLRDNEPARNLLREFFQCDALELLLLGTPLGDRQDLRDRLAPVAELARSDPESYDRLLDELQDRERRSRNVERCRKFGLAVQAAVQEALDRHNLCVKVVDRGFDLEVSDLEDIALKVEVDKYFVEVKATTTGEAKLTPTQAQFSSQHSDRFILCVVDLSGVPPERLDQPWSVEDVTPLAQMVTGVGTRVHGTWKLVRQARSEEVAIRNDSALRYAVPGPVWRNGVSISDWVDAAFGTAQGAPATKNLVAENRAKERA